MELQKQIVEWGATAFPEQDKEKTNLLKFKEEVDEFKVAYMMWLLEDTPENRINAAWELADIGMMVFQLAAELEVDFLSEVAAKLQVNKDRTWARDAYGVYSHIPREGND